MGSVRAKGFQSRGTNLQSSASQIISAPFLQSRRSPPAVIGVTFMQVTELAIPEVKLIVPKRFEDRRGFFSEIYNAGFWRMLELRTRSFKTTSRCRPTSEQYAGCIFRLPLTPRPSSCASVAVAFWTWLSISGGLPRLMASMFRQNFLMTTALSSTYQ